MKNSSVSVEGSKRRLLTRSGWNVVRMTGLHNTLLPLSIVGIAILLGISHRGALWRQFI